MVNIWILGFLLLYIILISLNEHVEEFLQKQERYMKNKLETNMTSCVTVIDAGRYFFVFFLFPEKWYVILFV